MTDRNTIIRECIAWLDARAETVARTADVLAGVRCSTLSQASEDMHALLSVPDQAEASEPSQSASNATAPVDHGPAADGEGEAGNYPWARPMCFACRGFGYVWAIPFEGAERYRVDCGNCKADWTKQQLGKSTAPKPDDWTPDERTVQLCIDKVGAINSHGVSSAAKAALQSLLPPDPIGALVAAFYEHDDVNETSPYTMPERVVRWLVSEGRLTL